ncbi:hypothetical protein AVEN_43725-1 [Araneus ventricosus]|uniref:Uncharacterized protein n=1 Tax=Araneus ventricosus TaxID=182803 RepID=A0A4Y2BVX7_ARAVE|nr:hypothetical protein AVEN_43725-1 [Araneus ventricosus]
MVVSGRLFHEHACPHAALRTQQLRQRFSGKSLTYSPQRHHLFQHLKRLPVKQHFPSDDAMQIDGCHRLAPLSGGGSLRHQ